MSLVNYEDIPEVLQELSDRIFEYSSSKLEKSNWQHKSQKKVISGCLVVNPETSVKATFFGVNIETTHCVGSLCAERAAIASAAAGGYEPGDIVALGVMSRETDYMTICGVCREVIQKISEFRNSDQRPSVQVLSLPKNPACRMYLLEEVSEDLP